MLLTKSNYRGCKAYSRRQTFRTCSAVSAKLAFAGTLFTQAIQTSGQRSSTAPAFESNGYEFTTCNVVSIGSDNTEKSSHFEGVSELVVFAGRLAVNIGRSLLQCRLRLQ